MEGLATQATTAKTAMIDVAPGVRQWPEDQRGRLIGRTKGGMNTKLHAVTDAEGRPIRFYMTAGQLGDFIGAAALLGSFPKAECLLADRGYVAGSEML